MVLNVIHRADSGERSRETLSFQLEAALSRGLKATVLVSYRGLQDDDLVRMLRHEYELHGVELGMHFHSMLCETFEHRFKSSCPAFYLLPKETKQAVLHEFFSQYAEAFGRTPESIGGYVLDAWTLSYIRTHFPTVKTAITNCFEEGVKMYRGNNHNWTLFSDGGPWGPYYPSRENVLCPAAGAEDAIGILGLPHLNRDMLLSLTHRDDLFASHPINLMRAGITVGDRSPYMDRFVEEWISQESISPSVYYSLFVSTPWLTEGHPFIVSEAEARGLYQHHLDDLASRKSSGSVQDMTMGEFADWHGASVGFQPDACLWNDILAGSGRQMFWHIDHSCRVTVDMNAGGTVVDLRPLAGRVNRDLGPDTEAQWNGNYPYLMSAELRGGFGKSSWTATITVDDERFSLPDRRTRASAKRTEDGTIELTLAPVEFATATQRIAVMTTMRFSEEGIEAAREIHLLEGPEPECIGLSEEMIATYGTTEYPESMTGIVLSAGDRSVAWNDNGASLPGVPARSCKARVPQANAVVVFATDREAEIALTTGDLFSAVFRMSIRMALVPGQRSRTWLQIQKDE